MLAAAAAGAAPIADPPQLAFEHLLPEDGLSVTTAYSILQDRTGFLWIGTEDGLYRFDGHRFEVWAHDPDDPATLATNDISYVFESRDGDLWLATWGGGLDRFDPRTGSFEHFKSRSGEEGNPGALQDDRVQHLFEDSSGTLWIGTFSGGLSRFDPGTGTFETFRHDPRDPASLSHDRVWRILEDPSGTLWIGTGRGLAVFDRATESFVSYRHVKGDPLSLSHDVVRTLYVDRQGSLWIGTGGGLNRWIPTAGKPGDPLSFERYLASPGGLSHDVITALYEDSRGTFWVGTRGGGLNILDRATGTWQTLRRDPENPASLSDDDVRAIYEDRSGVLWIATRAGGLNRLDLEPRKFESVSLPVEAGGPGGRIRGLAEDGEGRLWIGTGAGLWRYDREERSYQRFQHDPTDTGSLPSDHVHDLLVTRTGELWVAANPGLHRLGRGGDGFITYRHDEGEPRSLANDRVTALHEDRSGRLWVGTISGLDRLVLAPDGSPKAEETATFEHFEHRPNDPESLSESYVTALLDAKDGGLWVGTHNAGLNCCDVSGLRCERLRRDPRDAASLSSDRVTALYRQQSGTLWVGTVAGLNRLLPDGTFERYLVADGLPNAQVLGLLGDDAGRLWIATGLGLSRLDPETETFRNFTAGDGLSAGAFNQGATVHCRDGTLCFGGQRGFDCLAPENVVDSSYRPPVVLTGFEKLGQAASVGQSLWTVDSLRLSHQESFFAFEVAALDFTSPRDQLYSFLLEGHDREWSPPTRQRVVSYANVAPGHYLFRARGTNGDSVWSDQELRVAVEIVPPIWQNWWFRAVVCLTLAAVVGLGYHLRIQGLKRREHELSQRVEEGLADLRRSEERYRLLFERNLAGVVRARLDGTIVECNEAFARILGYSSPAECREQHRLAIDEPETSGVLLASLETSGSVAGHGSLARAKDGSLVSLLWNATLVRDAEAGDTLIEGTVIDLSERQRIEEGLRRTQKLESLGVLAGGIAHDFNNLLMSILGNAELGRIGLESGSDICQRLSRIETAAQQGAELARQMLAYSGKGEFIVTFLNISSEIRSMTGLLEGAVSKKARLVYELGPELPTVEADAGQIEQIIMNLLTNASEALGAGGGTIVIATASREYSRRELAETYLPDELPAGEYVSLEVRDDGAGMDEDLQLKVFDPFFTTKFTGRGLGLAAVLGIVRGHGGGVRIDSEVGRGSTFTVLFPARERPSRSNVTRPVAAPAPGEGYVLVVDDDEPVRRVATFMVESLGFQVLTATDGMDGLEVFRQRAAEITLVILDLAMPRLGGEEAFHAIREISPEARVILASGYEEKESRRLFADQGLAGFIQKPYRLGALRDKIQEVLGGEWQPAPKSDPPG